MTNTIIVGIWKNSLLTAWFIFFLGFYKHRLFKDLMCCWTVPRNSCPHPHTCTLRSLFIPFSWVVTSLANQKESHDPRHICTQTCKLNTFKPQCFKLKHAQSTTTTAKKISLIRWSDWSGSCQFGQAGRPARPS